ncbi:hypothetical protein, partial [Brevundimonas sp. BAL450]|uniref:hypothetical protein n=1 Tax=Brevundimonas sp. BAL450 TaxID=1708162 RepID=UPI001E5EE8E0
RRHRPEPAQTGQADPANGASDRLRKWRTVTSVTRADLSGGLFQRNPPIPDIHRAPETRHSAKLVRPYAAQRTAIKHPSIPPWLGPIAGRKEKSEWAFKS